GSVVRSRVPKHQNRAHDRQSHPVARPQLAREPEDLAQAFQGERLLAALRREPDHPSQNGSELPAIARFAVCGGHVGEQLFGLRVPPSARGAQPQYPLGLETHLRHAALTPDRLRLGGPGCRSLEITPVESVVAQEDEARADAFRVGYLTEAAQRLL